MASNRLFARRRPATILTALCLTSLMLQSGPRRDGLHAAKPPDLFFDSDSDGLTDAFEIYLNTASTSMTKTANPSNKDSDGDGQPDGFEYCLSGGEGVYSPGVVYPVVPTITFGCFQEGSDLVISMHMIPGEINFVQSFKAVVGAPKKIGVGYELIPFTTTLLNSIEAVGFHSYQGYLMSVYQFRLPVSLVASVGSLSIGAGANIAGYKVGDTLTLSYVNGDCFRWEYSMAGGGGSGSTLSGEAQPLNAPIDKLMYSTAEVCGTTDRREPTNTPGLLKSVVQTAGCNADEWACPGGVCSMSGPMGQPKPVIDIFALIPTGG